MGEKIYLYEVLVRGTANGEISGAHQIWNRAYIDEAGNVIAIKQGSPEALNADDVKSLVSENFVGTAAQIASLSLELGKARDVIGSQSDTISELAATIEKQSIEIAGLTAVVEAKDAEIRRMLEVRETQTAI